MEHSRKAERGVRPVPGELLKGLRAASKKGRKSEDASLVSSMLSLSGDLDHSISFGDVRNYLGPDGGKCTIRRQKQEFFLQFESPESARSCFASVAVNPLTPLTSGSQPGKPLVKGGKQRTVYISFLPPAESLTASLLSKTKTDSYQEPQASTQAPSKKASQELSNLGKSRIDPSKASVKGDQIGATLAPPNAEPSTSDRDLQQIRDTSVSDAPSSNNQPLNLKQELKSGDFSSQEHQSISIGQESNSRSVTNLHREESNDTCSSDLHSQEQHSVSLDSNSKANIDLTKHSDDVLHELLAQETLRLLTEKAHFQREAQEKGRQVDQLQRQVDLLLEELDTVHSRLSASESLASENLCAPDVPSLGPQVSEDGRRKRKKSIIASPAIRTESSPPVEKAPPASSDDIAEATGWSLETRTKAAAMDAASTGWGASSGSQNTPQKTNGKYAEDSGLDPKDRHKRGTKNKAGRKMDDVRTSVSSEAVERLNSRSSSDASGAWEVPGPYSKEQPDTLLRHAPHWDAESTPSSLGDGGTRTPSLQEGEWEWPASPGVQSQTGAQSLGADQQGRSARLEKGLLPVPGAEKKSQGLKRFEAGSPQSGREKDSRARKSRKEGDYAGAPRQRAVPEGKWPRGLVT